jgi:hypothetical protein
MRFETTHENVLVYQGTTDANGKLCLNLAAPKELRQCRYLAEH